MSAIRIFAAVFLTALLSTSAFAQTAAKTGQFNAWGTYQYNSSNGRVCYVLSIPTQQQPGNLDHGDIYFFVSQKPGQNIKYEPQFIAGYSFKEKSKVTVRVGNKSYSLFTRGKSAWLENPAEEPALIAAMQAGSTMSVNAVSGRGNRTSYDFSLSGITAALKSINNCK